MNNRFSKTLMKKRKKLLMNYLVSSNCIRRFLITIPAAISFLLLTSSCGTTNQYQKLNKKYDKAQYEKVLKKANRYIQKNPADPTPLYFKSLIHTHFYKNTNDPLELRQALTYMDQARRKKIPDYLKGDIQLLTDQLVETANNDISEIEDKAGALTTQKIHELTQKLEQAPEIKLAKGEITYNNSSPQKVTFYKVKGLRKTIVKKAQKYIGTPYRYGGTTTRGFDCSGFTEHVFAEAGINLPRTAAQQAISGKKIRERKAKPGDLVFFTKNKSGGNINHVAIILDTDPKGIKKVIHSTSRGVIIDERSGGSWKSYWLPRKNHIASYIDD